MKRVLMIAMLASLINGCGSGDCCATDVEEVKGSYTKKSIDVNSTEVVRWLKVPSKKLTEEWDFYGVDKCNKEFKAGIITITTWSNNETSYDTNITNDKEGQYYYLHLSNETYSTIEDLTASLIN